MTRIDNLQFTTDFDTLKNDDTGTALIVIPGSDVIAGNATTTYSATATVGEAQSLLLVSYTNNVSFPAGDYASVSTSIQSTRTGTVGGVGGFAYSIIIRFAHTGGSNILLTASITNPYGTALTLAPTTESYNFRIRSFKVPRFA